MSRSLVIILSFILFRFGISALNVSRCALNFDSVSKFTPWSKSAPKPKVSFD